MREAVEETGLRFQAWAVPPPLVHLDVHSGADNHLHLDLRYALRPLGDDEPAPGPGESPEVRWFTWQEAISIADPGLKGLLLSSRPDQAG
jgi:8-oxo-dGTP pyrophosphatase MutT (NUDIX family)